MKLDEQQIKALQTYMGKNLKYRETYFEFYDHVLSAMEMEADNADVTEARDKVITADFGGIEGMRQAEANYQQSIFVEMKKKYFNYARQLFSFPGLLILAMVVWLMYNLLKQPWFTFMDYLVMLALIRSVAFFCNYQEEKLNMALGLKLP